MDAFWTEARASGNNVFTRGSSFPLCLLEKGDEVAILVDSSLMEKRTERPLLSRANTGLILAKDLGVFGVGLPIPQNRPPPRGQKKCLRVDRPTPQTNRHRLIRERGDEHVRVERRLAVTVAVLLRDACLWGNAQSAGSRAMVDGGGVWSAYPRYRVYAAVEGNGAESVVSVAELRA